MEDMYSVTDPYGTYQTKGEDNPYDILLRMKSWQNEIRKTISKVTDNVTNLHEQQTQILQNIDSIDLNILDILTDLTGKSTQISQILLEVGAINLAVSKNTSDLTGQSSQISQLLLEVGQVKINVSETDTRLGNAEGTLVVQAGLIGSKVSLTDFTGATISSMIVQDAYSINMFSQALNITSFVTFSALQNAGQTIINGANISTGTILLDKLFGNLFRIGNMSGGTALDIYATQGSHRITSYDAAGMRIEAINSNLSLSAAGWSVYSLSKLWARNNFQVTGFTELQDTESTGTITARNLSVKNSQGISYPVVTTLDLASAGYLSYNQMTSYIAGLNLVTLSYLNSALAQKETDIVAWANGKFALK